MIKIGLSRFTRRRGTSFFEKRKAKRVQTHEACTETSADVAKRVDYQDIQQMLEEADLDSNSIARARKQNQASAYVKPDQGELWQLRKVLTAP